MNTRTQPSKLSLEASGRVFPEEANTVRKTLATADLIRDSRLTRRQQVELSFCHVYCRLMKHILITSVAGLSLLIPGALGLGLFLPGAPTVFSPLPALTVIPTLLLDNLHVRGNVAVILPVFFFLLWNPQLFRGEVKVPRRSYVLLAALIVLTVIDLVLSWKWGVQYEGPQYTAVVSSVNIAWLTFLGLAFARTRKGTNTLQTSLFLHWMLFAWLGWYAFPWLGELP